MATPMTTSPSPLVSRSTAAAAVPAVSVLIVSALAVSVAAVSAGGSVVAAASAGGRHDAGTDHEAPRGGAG